jgi:hypothetical protein
LALGVGTHQLNPREVKELEIENHNRGNGVAVSRKVRGGVGRPSTDGVDGRRLGEGEWRLRVKVTAGSGRSDYPSNGRWRACVLARAATC